MTAITYKNLALEWQPAQVDSRNFHRIVMVVLLFATILLLIVSFIDAPKKDSRARVDVPNRIAEFISRKEKPIVQPPKPEKPPLPKPKKEPVAEVLPEAVIEPTPIEKSEPKPLTDSQKQARKVAEKSGLLALANELNDLIETTDVQNKVNRKLSAELPKAADSNLVASYDANAISAGVAQSGGNVDASQYAKGREGAIALESRDSSKITNELLANANKAKGTTTATKNRSTGAAAAGEDVTIVFDKNKGSLYSLYERERRTTPGLQGKIVLQLIISPEGDVTDIKIISSELNSPTLEAKLISRIKLFKFKAGGDKPITITYPIEFLPS
jgi:periplasmic protein TonB